jgi:hypothetical protein
MRFWSRIAAQHQPANGSAAQAGAESSGEWQRSAAEQLRIVPEAQWRAVQARRLPQAARTLCQQHMLALQKTA